MVSLNSAKSDLRKKARRLGKPPCFWELFQYQFKH